MKKFLVLIAALCFLAGLAGTAAAAPATFFDFDGDQVADTLFGPIASGSSFTADIYFTGLEELKMEEVIPADDGLQSFGFSLSFNGAWVNVSEITVAPSWFLPSTITIDNSAGLASVFGGRLGGITNEPILLASFDFDKIEKNLLTLTMEELPPASFAAFVTASGIELDELGKPDNSIFE